EPVADIFPFADEQVLRIARTEPTLRDMLQQCRHLFDHLVYGPDDARESGVGSRESDKTMLANPERERGGDGEVENTPSPTVGVHQKSRITPSDIPELPPEPETTSRVASLLGRDEEPPAVEFKKVEIIEAAADEVPMALPVEQSAAGSGQRAGEPPPLPAA